MEDKRSEHDVSSDVRKNLSSEFEQLAEVDPGPCTTDPAGPGPNGLGTAVSVHAPVVPPAQASTTTDTVALHVSFSAPAPTEVVGVH